MIIGVVGGIGSGKSYIAKRIEAISGGCRIDADEIAHQVRSLPEVLQAMNDHWQHLGFHVDVWNDAARKSVAGIVFRSEDRTELTWLETLLWPLVMKRLDDIISACDKAIIILDMPLLLETKFRYDSLWFVDVPQNIREKRAASRSSVPLTASEIKKREARQIPLDEKRALAHVVIHNIGSAHVIDEQIRIALATLA